MWIPILIGGGLLAAWLLSRSNESSEPATAEREPEPTGGKSSDPTRPPTPVTDAPFPHPEQVQTAKNLAAQSGPGNTFHWILVTKGLDGMGIPNAVFVMPHPAPGATLVAQTLYSSLKIAWGQDFGVWVDDCDFTQEDLNRIAAGGLDWSQPFYEGKCASPWFRWDVGGKVTSKG